jgi:hypothetical protein
MPHIDDCSKSIAEQAFKTFKPFNRCAPSNRLSLTAVQSFDARFALLRMSGKTTPLMVSLSNDALGSSR